MLYEIGKITGVKGEEKVTGVSTGWINSITPIEKGNTLVIYNDNGTTDIYGIESVVSNTEIAITRPLTQSFTEIRYGIMIAETASVSQFSNQLQRTLAGLITNTDERQDVIDTILEKTLQIDRLFSEIRSLGTEKQKQARDNLGIVDVDLTGYMKAENNLSDVKDKAQAKKNLGIVDPTAPDLTGLLVKANNLSDVPDKAQARTNLGITTPDLTPLLNKNNNLSELTNKATALTNLGGASLTKQNNFTLKQLILNNEALHVGNSAIFNGIGSSFTRTWDTPMDSEPNYKNYTAAGTSFYWNLAGTYRFVSEVYDPYLGVYMQTWTRIS